MKLILFLLAFTVVSASARTKIPNLKEYSDFINRSLPEVYDHATKLMKTSVENDNITYHFMLRATEQEYSFAFPKVKEQILKTICSRKQESYILTYLKANIVYRYEDEKGKSLGQFMVRPEHCSKR